MNTCTGGITSSVRAHETKLVLSSSYPGFSCISIFLPETREGDLPIPRFSASYMTDEMQADRPFVIGAPNFLRDCDAYIPPNGGIVVNLGRQLDVLYALVGDSAEWQSDVLYHAKQRIEERLDSQIHTLDMSFKRSPYANFQLTTR